MKYFLDTEFLEGTQKKFFGKTKPTIDLISIGIVSEDNREYYAISKDFNLKEAWNRNDLDPNHKRNYKQKDNYWIRENVLRPIFNEWMIEHNGTIVRLGLPIPLESNEFTYKNFKKWLKLKGKTNKEIASEVFNFVNPDLGFHISAYNNSELKEGGRLDKHFNEHNVKEFNSIFYAQPEFYTYYGAYDWVVFCWLFGKMIDLPKGFPMYSKDLKQMLDEKENSLKNEDGTIELVSEIIPEHGCAMVGHFKSIKDFGTYPKQTNEHNALADARWNLKLYQFLNSL